MIASYIWLGVLLWMFSFYDDVPAPYRPWYVIIGLVLILAQCYTILHQHYRRYQLRVLENELVTEANDEMDAALLDDGETIPRAKDRPAKQTRDMNADELLDYARRRVEE